MKKKSPMGANVTTTTTTRIEIQPQEIETALKLYVTKTYSKQLPKRSKADDIELDIHSDDEGRVTGATFRIQQ